MRRLLAVFLLLPLCWLPAAAPSVEGETIRIGVLSHRGDQATLEAWSPSADYLTASVPGYRFEIVPLDFDEVDPAVERGEVDFVLVNPGIYVNLEVSDRVSRIATLKNRLDAIPYNIFGGVVFTRRDRTDLKTLADLKGSRFMAVDETSLGGFEMAWREMRAQGIEPYRDFAELSFGGIHDRVVFAVRDGLVDAGTVRTDILERMAQEGQIDLNEFRVIGMREDEAFPLLHSTRLYPEWPFSKVRHTSNELAQKVAVALFNMPADHPAALAGRNAGWTIPLDYQPVHELFRDLRLPPYQNLGKFTLSDALRKYWPWLLTGLLVLLFMVVMTAWVMRLNRELQKAKRKLEQQHELILESVADGICGVDMNGNTTFVNRAMEQILGWRAADIIGQNQHQLLHHTLADGRSHASSDCPVYGTFRNGEARFVEDDVFWKPDGSSIPVEYSSTPIIDPSGQVLGSVVVFRDISARKRAEEEARQHQRELGHVARLSAMGEMASCIAHELNQPLTAIATSSQACIRLLESGEVAREQCADVLERIASRAEHAGEVIRQLRRFVRKEDPQCAAVDLNALVHNVFTLFAPEARRAGVTVQFKLASALPAAFAQPIQIEQVIFNLARNAIEAMQVVPAAERLLSISTAMETDAGVDRLMLSVADSGPGIAAEIAEQLFDPFVTSKEEGMGLGLSISRGIIEAHRGGLSARNGADGGAVFLFTLPIDRRGSQRAEALPERPASEESSNV